MQNILEMTLDKKLILDKEMNLNIDNIKQNYSNIVLNVLDKSSNYIIKALPLNNNIKDFLIQVKEAFKTKDFKQLLNTVINSTVKQGLEILNLPYKVISELNNLKKVSLNGGIRTALANVVDVTLNNIGKNNIFEPYINMFSKSLQNYISSNDFLSKLDSSIQRTYKKVDNFNDLCNKWYNYYDSFNLDKINEISELLNKKLPTVTSNLNCIKNNRIIQNITELVNNKKDKLSNLQLQICQNM